jgi:hypothetical protein
MRRALPAVALGALGLLAGCVRFEELPIASIHAELVDDPAGAPLAYFGEFDTMAVVQLSTDSVGWVSLGQKFSLAPTAPVEGVLLAAEAPTPARVALQSGTPSPILFGASVRAETFRFVRIILMPVIVNTSGISPGYRAPEAVAIVSGTVGDTTIAATEIRFAQSRELVIDQRIEPLALRDGDRATIVWDINSERWITREALRTRRLDRAQVAAALTLRVAR